MRHTDYPLSLGQKSIWLLNKLSPDSGCYNVNYTWEIRDKMDIGLLKTAVLLVTRKHPLLRATFIHNNHEIRQQIHPQMSPSFSAIDAMLWNEDQFSEFIEKETYSPFNFENTSLCRWTILNKGKDHYLLSMTIHHIISDLWSVMILMNDLKGAYNSLKAGRQPDLPAPAAAYSEFVRAQTEKIKTDVWSTSLDFWKEKLKGELPILNLPTDKPRPAGFSCEIESYSFDFDREELQALHNMAMQEGVTLYVLFFAFYLVFLHRYTDQEDIVVGTPVAGRKHGEYKSVIGYFVNTVSIRAAIDRTRSFTGFLSDVLNEVKAVRNQQEVPLPFLVENLRFARASGVAPLFQTLFSWEDANSFENIGNPMQSCGSAAEEIWDLGAFVMTLINKKIPNEFELTLRIVNLQHRLRVVFDFSPKVFQRSTLVRMAANFRTLVGSILKNREQTIGDIDLLSEKENDLSQWQHGPVGSEPELKTFPQVFESIVKRHSGRVALIYNKVRFLYSTLDTESNRLARYLYSLGVGKGTVIGLCVERSPEMIVSLLAIWKVGAAYLPLDPAYPKDRLNYMISDSRAECVITLQKHLPCFDRAAAALVMLDEQKGTIAGRAGDPYPAQWEPSDAAYIIYTSGSTGMPKGVVIEHKGLVNVVRSKKEILGVDCHKRILQFASFNFDASLAEIVMALGTGSALVLADKSALQPGPDLKQTLTDHNITHLTITPSALAHLPEADFPDLEMIIVAGEPLTENLVKQWYDKCRLINNYGPTEATIWATYAEIKDPEQRITIGRPIFNTSIYILDSNLKQVPIGVIGEMYIGGIGLAREYLNNPEKTAENFINNPFQPDTSAKLYKTGDLARYLDDGTIEYHGRSDFQVKIRGYRIEIGELEAVIKQHPDIEACLVSPSADTFGQKRLIGYLIVRDRQSFSMQNFKRYLAGKLPEFMLPSLFMLLDHFPINLNGKIDVTALPKPDESRPVLTSALVTAATDLEKELLKVWRQVLGVKEIGIGDNFFELGGNSLLMLQIFNRLPHPIRQATSLVDLFEYPTVKSLAGFLNQSEATNDPVPQNKVKPGPLSPTNGDIAIIAMIGRFPGAESVEELWQNLLGGVESITHFSDEELLAAGVSREHLIHPDYVRAKGVIRHADLFDSHFFGYSPKQADITDPQQRLFLECSWEALETAGYDPARYPGRIGVFGGTGFNSYRCGLDDGSISFNSTGDFPTMIGNEKDFLCTRVAYKLNLKGPAVVTQSACSTSLLAVHTACQSLKNHECDMALAGGVSIIGSCQEGYFYEKGGILSPDGHCRPFDALGQGTVPSQGIGLIVLKRLDEAKKDGDTIHAVIKGSAVNNDGSMKAGYTAPGVEGQVSVIRAALENARVDPATVRYIETHGTGTPLGDPIEVRALTKVYGTNEKRTERCAMGAVKSNLGHLDAAAGITGLIKAALTLKHRQLVPLANFETPNPAIDFEKSPFTVSDRLTDLIAGVSPLRAGVSSFGIGGTNAHAILEEGPEQPKLAEPAAWHILPLSAKTQSALQKYLVRLQTFLSSEQSASYRMSDIAFTLQNGRQEFNHRCVITCRDRADAIQVLATKSPVRMTASQTTASNRPVAFLFPGQGAQYVNMGRELYENEPLFKKEMDICFDRLKHHSDFDLKSVVYPCPEEEEEAHRRITQTYYTQPILFTIEYATARLWMAYGVQPQCMIGHSIGEYTAACLAGVMSLDDALKLVIERGRLIRQLPGGAMLSVRLSEQDVRPLLNGRLSLAAVNTPNRCVLSGDKEAVNQLQKQLIEDGKDCIQLHTSHAFHSHLLEPVLEKFKQAVSSIRLNEPSIPYLSNVTGDWIKRDQVLDPEYWVRHLRDTVQFSLGIRQILKKPDIALLEVGPGRVLRTLSVQNLEKKKDHVVVSSIRHLTSRHSDREYILASLGRLWLHGVKIDWEKLNSTIRRFRVPLPTYPFERRRHWIAEKEKPGLSSAKIPNTGDWFYLPTWKQVYHSHRFSGKIELPYAMKWLVFVDRVGLGKRIAEALRANEQQVIEIAMGNRFGKTEEHGYQLNPRREEDYEELMQALFSRGFVPQKIIHMWSVIGKEYWGLDYFRSLQHLGFFSIINLVKALEKQALKRLMQIQVVTDNMQEVQGNEQLSPGKSTVLSLVNSLHLEHPHLYCQSVDIALAGTEEKEVDDLIPRLIREIGLFGEDRVVAFRNEYRWVQAYEKRYWDSPSQSAIQLKQEGVYLVTGGLGSIGLIVAEYLAKSSMAKIALVGRSQFPQKAEWQAVLEARSESDLILQKIERLKQLERYGAEVMIIQADVSDADQMAVAVKGIEEAFGQVNGVFHAAGEIGQHTFHKISKLTRETCNEQFKPKVEGLFVLEQIFKSKQVSFIMMFSSLSSVTGGVDFTAYAAANLFMDGFAKLLDRYSPIRWISVDWDGWKTDEDQDLYFLMTPEEGTEVLHRILSQHFTTQLIVSTIDLSNRLSRLRSKSNFWLTDRDPEQNTSLALTPAGEEESYVAPRNDIEHKVALLWQDFLNIDRISIHEDFFELGGDSLMAIRITAKLEEVFPGAVTERSILEESTIADLAQDIKRKTECRESSTLAQRMETYQSLVQIQKGDSSNPPLFLVHPGGGFAFYYVALARNLGEAQPAFAFQSRGIKEGTSMLTTVEEMAQCYLSELLDFQPFGPYLLGGASFGGMVAYEMASRLKAKGFQVDLLMMIDTPGPITELPKTAGSDVEFAQMVFGKELLPDTECAKLQDMDQLFDYVREANQKNKTGIELTKKLVSTCFTVAKANHDAMRDYQPEAGPHNILFFKHTEALPEYSKQPERTWIDLAEEGVTVIKIPGNHYTMTMEPNVSKISGHLKAALGKRG